MANETTPGDSIATDQANGSRSFIAQTQDAIGSAVNATVGAVKEHPVAAAAIAAGAAAAVGGAAYAVTQYRGQGQAPSKGKK